jgi:anti-sigma factor RsiW
MDHKTARNNCLEWIEGRLDAEERRLVQQHLDECGECAKHFEKAALLVERPQTSLLPRLTPDPFLASRIRSLAEERRAPRARRGALGWVRLSAALAMLVLAAAAGVYLGQGLYANARSAQDVELAEAYYEAFSPSDFAGVWETLLSELDVNGAQKGAK